LKVALQYAFSLCDYALLYPLPLRDFNGFIEEGLVFNELPAWQQAAR